MNQIRQWTYSLLVVTGVLSVCSIHSYGQNSPSKLGSGPTASLKPFSLQQDRGAWWLVRPDGSRFFSSGVCCVEPGQTWEAYDPKKPAYAAWRQHPTITDWSDTTIDRLKSWGFTTIGGWSDYAGLKRSTRMDMPYTMVLHLGASSGAPWWDMWDPKIIGAMEKAAHDQIVPVRADPRLLGYYTDNELGWWNGELFEMTLGLPEHSTQRTKLIEILRNEYANSWSRLSADFTGSGASSFESLARSGKLYLKPGSAGIRVVKRFVSMIALRYYTLVRQTIRKYDSRGLILGDRYQSFYYPEVASASRDLVDIASTNLNPAWIDGSYARFFLSTLHSLTHRPLAVGEFYMCSSQNRSGNKNSSSGFPLVATQQERASGFVGTLNSLARTPYVVGADWFQYSDEPTDGRGDGENYNMGLVDIDDRPYEEMAAAASGFNREGAHSASAEPTGSASEGAPACKINPLSDWKPQHAMLNWDRTRGFVPARSNNPLADLYLCWSADAIYLGAYALDVLEQGLYRDKKVPEIDRPTWTISIAGSPAPIQITLGANRKPVVRGASAAIQVVDTTGAESGVFHAVGVRLPAALFGKRRFAAGDTVRLQSTYATHARAYSTSWNGKYQLIK